MGRCLLRYALCACLAITLSHNASGAISTGFQNAGDPQGELFLAVWDPDNQVSYTRDLGIGVLDTDFATATFNISADALFLSTFAMSNFANLRYSVVGVNNDLADAFVLGAWTTSNDDVLNNSDFSFSGLNTMTQNIRNFTIGVNEGIGSSDFAADLSGAIADTTDNGYYANEQNFNENFGGLTEFSTGALIGESMAFYSIAITSETGGNTVATQFADGGNPFVWTLGLDGTLSYAPVPIPAAVWLFGSALAAFLGLRRRAS